MGKLDLSPIDLVSPTLEAAVLSGVSGLLAQSFTAYKQKNLFSFDLVQIVQFIIFSAITTPPNYAFQYFLEATFPARTTASSDDCSTSKEQAEKEVRSNREPPRSLNLANTIIKFLLDQSIAATVNTALYICLMGSIKGYSYEYIQQDLCNNFWPLLFAGYRFWPFVCLLNFAMIPMKYRPLVGSLAGLAWGIFLSLR